MTNLPYALEAHPFFSWVFTAVGAVFFVASAVWALTSSRRLSTAIPVLALAGGFIAALEEPWINTMIQLWYPRDSPLIAFIAMEHAQPLYVFLVYPGFVGLGAYVVYRSLVTHPDGRHLWRFFAGIVLLDLVFELPTTAAGVFYYYGDQPMQLVSNGWPFWAGPINAAGPLLAGWLMYRLVPVLSGARRIFVVVALPPLAYAGIYGAVGWPVYTLLKTDVPMAARWAAAVVTIALCVGTVAMIKLSLSRSADETVRFGDDAPHMAIDKAEQR
ncbi:hypothetical protein ORI20_28880 [Mycobacterium sp. CVI_P3]|uniref:Carotenoid biosynthesis protein n=1 Tax=Mycobacterium pinniadriaticum TaxID=2994102 RepID=A0ABT3SMC3_9MYCO|nr:hypothetical protein [Mycobacterium pinniadriaticum]MCX2934286.1 hypothetical protein [Mycobacterium pinniadriaticum]MCX2940676.1 hypothetical protein [Mycobacterium pinniadriaticum]